MTKFDGKEVQGIYEEILKEKIYRFYQRVVMFRLLSNAVSNKYPQPYWLLCYKYGEKILLSPLINSNTHIRLV